jgi:hypothetical protein
MRWVGLRVAPLHQHGVSGCTAGDDGIPRNPLGADPSGQGGHSESAGDDDGCAGVRAPLGAERVALWRLWLDAFVLLRGGGMVHSDQARQHGLPASGERVDGAGAPRPTGPQGDLVREVEGSGPTEDVGSGRGNVQTLPEGDAVLGRQGGLDADPAPPAPAATPQPAPVPPVAAQGGLISGQATHYGESYNGQPLGCAGAGLYSSNNPNIAAVSPARYQEWPCGTKLRLCGPGGCAVVTRVDSCPGCYANLIDLSESANMLVCATERYPYPHTCSVTIEVVN